MILRGEDDITFNIEESVHPLEILHPIPTLGDDDNMPNIARDVHKPWDIVPYI